MRGKQPDLVLFVFIFHFLAAQSLHVADPLRAHATGMSIAPLRERIRTRSDSFERRLLESALVLHFPRRFFFSRYKSMLHLLLVQVQTKSKFRMSLRLASTISPSSMRSLRREIEPETHPSWPGIGIGTGVGEGRGVGVGLGSTEGVGSGDGIGSGTGTGCGAGIGTGAVVAGGVDVVASFVAGIFRTPVEEVALLIAAKSSCVSCPASKN